MVRTGRKVTLLSAYEFDNFVKMLTVMWEGPRGDASCQGAPWSYPSGTFYSIPLGEGTMLAAAKSNHSQREVGISIQTDNLEWTKC